MKRVSTLFMLLFLVWGHAQTDTSAHACTCWDNMKWLIRTMEQNDAGFHIAIDRRGEEAYRIHKEKFLAQSAQKVSPGQCLHLMNEYLRFFRKGHLAIIPNEGGLPWQHSPDTQRLKELYAWTPVYEMSNKAVDKFLRKILKKGTGDEWEGLWHGEEYDVVMVKDSGHYIGFIYASHSPYWQPGQIVLRIYPQGTEKFRMRLYTDRRAVIEKIPVRVYKNKYLLTPYLHLVRTIPALPADTTIEAYMDYIKDRKPRLIRLSDSTLLMRIPSFGPQDKVWIDSLVQSRMADFTSTPYLIIDLRNNTGGMDDAYNVLLPLIYTQPIRVREVAFLSTPLNNRRMEMFMRDSMWPSEVREWAARSLEKLRRHPGEFVSLNDKPFTEIRLDTVLPRPRKVVVLINERCASSTEQFLLAAKQSFKVKLAGKPTAGALDISNLNWTVSPCGDYLLLYGLSKSLRLPGMSVDGIGIQPDFYLGEELPPYQWIDEVREMLEYSPGRDE